jgi:hypothetical protein
MKNSIKIVGLLLSLMISMATYAQRTVSLRQFETIQNAYRNSPDPVAEGLDDGEDITYIKDTNNELNQFVGTWKGTYHTRNYEFVFIKRIAYKVDPSDEKARDLLKVWVTVKNSTGGLIYTNATFTETSNGFTGANFQSNTNTYRLNFTGTCYNESGNVFIYLMPDGKMSLSFAILPDMQSDDCPNGFTPVLPVSPNEVLLTKQP